MRSFVVAALLTIAATAHAEVTAPVKTDTGPVTGVSENGVESFKGIPFAAPPVGTLRWRAPQPAAAWSGVRAADKFGPACFQQERPGGTVRRADMSEDCLSINIWRPAGATKPLPVMVWIYGGGLTSGWSGGPVYDGTQFAKGGVVLVSMNYRIGRLGFFAHPALTKENADGGRLGNYGLMDQIAALEWVKRNIAAFGGDANNVTIFGESAGGLSVDGLMISPPARGLFHKAISQSGYGRGHFVRISEPTPSGKPSAETEGVAFAKQLGLENADLAALRALPADKITDSFNPGGAISFYLDGKTIADDMWAVFRAGKEAPVPFMLGSNGLEFANSSVSGRAVRDFLTQEEEDSLTPHYGTGQARADNLSSDLLFTQQARALARMHIKNGHPAYLYLFDVVPAADAATVKGAPHAAELRYVFDTLGAGSRPLTGAGEQKIAKTMNAQWRAFAATGHPNSAGLPNWPAYDGTQIMSYTLKGAAAQPEARTPRLDALSKLVDPKS